MMWAMTKLGLTSLISAVAGVLITAIAWFSWPKSESIARAADPTANIFGLSLGGLLLSAAVLAILLSMHVDETYHETKRATKEALREHAEEERKRLERATRSA